MSATGAQDARAYARAAMTLEVQYRSVGSFLVSYSVNLSKGGLFLANAELLPIGAQLRVRFAVPGAPPPGGAIESDAVVAWVRAERTADGLPAGLGLSFDRLDEQIGAQIDAVVRSFSGVSLIVVAQSADGVERLARQLGNTLSCTITRCTTARDALVRLQPQLDLLVLDLDSLAADGVMLVAQVRARMPHLPVLALTRYDEFRRAAASAGAAVLDNPPAQSALRALVIDLVSQPLRR